MKDCQELSPQELVRKIYTRPGREESGLFLLEGSRALIKAEEGKFAIEQLLLCKTLLRSPVGRMVTRRLSKRGVPTCFLSPAEFQPLCRAPKAQGILAIARQRWQSLSRTNPRKGLCWVIVRHVRSPGNLGSISRTCEAVGAAGLIFLGSQSDPYDPAVVRASMGSLFSMRFIRTGHRTLGAWAFRNRCQIIGCSPSASSSYDQLEVSKKRPILLFLGEERQGLSDFDEELCDDFITIPMVGKVDSLNISVAAGLVLYEVFRKSGFA